jgi:uncharacterized protein (TIGR03437 family)
MAASLPVWIEPNKGQWSAANGEFVAQSGSWQAGIRRDSVSFDSGSEIVRLRFDGARSMQVPQGEGRQAGTSSYFLGSDPAKWITAVPHYSRIRYRDVYPGIDLVYYGSPQGKLEYDFEISPTADASRIRLSFEGLERVERTSKGDLLLITPSGKSLVQRKPVVFEELLDGTRRTLASSYVISKRSVSFQIAARTSRKSRVVVDPVIEYSTFLGGAAFESARAMACDNNGNCYLAGEGKSRNGLVGPLQSSGNGGQEVVVAKVNHVTNTLVYYAVIGGDLDDAANAIVVDTNGNAYIAGTTKSLNFPTRNAAQPTPGGTLFSDAFVAKLSADGASLMYSTYVGGTGPDEGRNLAVDRNGAAYVVGSTGSREGFPFTPGAMQGTFRGSLLQQSTTGFITKVHPTGNRFSYSTLIGGSRQDDVRAVAVEEGGSVVIAGTTTSLDFPVKNAFQSLLASATSLFIARVSPEADQLQFSTYYGGPAINSLDAIALDASGNIVIAGSTSSTGFPVKNAAQPTFGGGRTDGFVAKIASGGNEVQWATYVGGSDADNVAALAIHRDGSVSCAGSTNSQNFPQRLSPLAPVGKSDGFVTRLTAGGDAIMSSMVLGGSEDDRALALSVDANDASLIAGWTGSRDFPRSGGLQNMFGGGTGDMFLMRAASDGLTTSLAPTPLVVSSSVVSFVSVVGQSRPPAPAPIQVTAAGPAPVTFTVDWTLGGSGNWISAGPERAETPATVNVFANPATLAPGTYQGMVRLTPVAGGTPSTINVTFQILNPSAELTSVSPSWVPAGSGDAGVTIYGRGFAEGATIRMVSEDANGTQVVTPTNITPTAVTFVAPRTFLFRDTSFELRVLNPDAEPSNPVSLLVGGRAISVAPNAVLSAATGAHSGLAPGQMIVIMGTGLGPGELTKADASVGFLPNKLAGVRVLFNGLAAPLVFVWDRQICAMVPYSVTPGTYVEVVVESQNNRSVGIPVSITTVAPGIFTADSWVYGYGTIWNENGSENATGNSAKKGSVVTFIMTGAGLPVAPVQDGRINVPPFGMPANPVSVIIDGQEAEVLLVVDAPGQVSGLMQVRTRVPQGTKSGEVPLSVKVGDVVSQPVKVIVE